MAITINVTSKLNDYALKQAQREMMLLGKQAIASNATMSGAFLRSGAAMQAFGARMSGVGRTMNTHVTLPLALAGVASAKFAMDYQKQMTMVRTQAGATAKDVRYLSGQILALKDMQQGPVELAKAMYHLKSVGMSNVQALRALQLASKGAAVGSADLEETSTALAAAWKTGISGATSFGQSIGTVNAIVGAGNMRMGDLAEALGTGVLPSAKAFGLTFRDVGAALALMTDEGVPAAAAATRLRMTFAMMGAPTQAAAKALDTIHLKATDMAVEMRKPDGLVKALELLREHLKGLSKVDQAAVLTRIFGGGKTSGGVLTLLNNLDSLQKKYVQIGKQASGFGAAAAAQAKTDAAAYDRAKSSLERSAVIVGQDLMPSFAAVAKDVEKISGAFDALPPATRKWVVELGVAVAFLGPLARIIGMGSTGGSKLTSLLGLLGLRFGRGAAGRAAAGAAAKGAGKFIPWGSAAGAGEAAGAGSLAGAIIPVAVMTMLPLVIAAIAGKFSPNQTGPGPGSTKAGGGKRPGFHWVPGPGRYGGSWVPDVTTVPLAEQTTAQRAATAAAAIQGRININPSGNIRNETAEIIALAKIAKKPIILGDIKADHSQKSLLATRDRLVKDLHLTVHQANDVMGRMFDDWDPKNTLTPHMVKMKQVLLRDLRQQERPLKRAGRDLGTNFTAGLSQGLDYGMPEVSASAIALAQGVRRDVAQQLKIKSPSQVAHHLGVMWDKGLAGGIDAGRGWISAAVRRLARHMVDNALSAQASGRNTMFAGLGGPGGSGFGGVAPAASANVALGKKMAAAYGWTGGQWNALYRLWSNESGWRSTAQNPTSSAFGIAQFLDSTWAGTGYHKSSDPRIQIAAGLQYIHQRYRTPASALSFWMRQTPHWYDQGGYLPPGVSIAVNNTGRPEPVGPAISSSTGGDTYNFYLTLPPSAVIVGTMQELADGVGPYLTHARGQAARRAQRRPG